MSDPASQASPFSRGLRAALDGIKLAFEDDGVHKAYFKIALTLLLLVSVIDVGALWALYANTAPTTDTGVLWTVGLWLLRVVGTIVTLLFAPLLAVLTINIIFPFFNQGAFLAGLRAADPERAQRVAAGPGMPAAASMGGAVLRLLGFVGLSLVFLLLNLIPVVGSVLATVGQTWLTARTVAWELLDPYFDCVDVRYREQRAFVAVHRKALLGFGLPLSLMLAIPILGPLAFGLVQAAAGTFVARELPVHPREGAAATPGQGA